MTQGSGQWNKANGDPPYIVDYNCVHYQGEQNKTVLETSMEQAYAITKLQYCRSLTDISHDYFVADVFTSATGYNNTVNTTCIMCNTTATSCVVCNVTCITCNQNGCNPYLCMISGNYCINLCAYGGSDWESAGWVCGKICVNAWENPNCFCAICFCAQCCFYGSAAAYNCSSVSYSIVGSHDDSSLASCNNISCTVTNCYCYVCACANYFNFYCNGTCKCQVCLTTCMPNIIVTACAWAYRFGYPGATRGCFAYQILSPCSYIIGITSSTYSSSGLTGHYCNLPLGCTTTTNCLCSCNSNNYGNNAGRAYSEYSLCQVAWICTKLNTPFNSINCQSYNMCFWHSYCGNNGTASFCILNTPSVVCGSYTATGTDTKNYFVLTWCYVSSCCYNFYINGTCCSNVCMTAFPDICWITCATAASSGRCTNSIGCFSCMYTTFAFSRITTNNVNWSSPVKMVYYTDEAFGLGTRVYNVVDVATGCCIACNVPANTLCLLSCCVCCHRYEIIQCTDAISCIKSYVIAVGRA